MPNTAMNINGGIFVSLTSLSQNWNAASKIDMVYPTTQNQDLPAAPRIPGAGKGYVLDVAPDFDAPLNLADAQL